MPLLYKMNFLINCSNDLMKFLENVDIIIASNIVKTSFLNIKEPVAGFVDFTGIIGC